MNYLNIKKINNNKYPIREHLPSRRDEVATLSLQTSWELPSDISTMFTEKKKITILVSEK